MLSAIYYPHTAVRSENFLKHAVLYWDQIEYISPSAGFDDLPRYSTSAMKVLSRVLTPRVPSIEEKQEAHEQILAFISDGVPDWLMINRHSDPEDHRTFAMFASKLLPETWQALKDRHLVVEFEDYVSHTFLGLTLMAILAKSCAGSLKHTITDQDDSYHALLKYVTTLSGEAKRKNEQTKNSPEFFSRWLALLESGQLPVKDKVRKTLVSISLDVIDASELSVESLLELRHDRAQLATELRQNYANAIEKYVAQLSTPDLTETDARTLTNDFKRCMEMDRDRLYAELRLTALKTVLSKEVAVSIAAPLTAGAVLASSGIGSVVGAGIAVGALAKLGVEYRSARNSVFVKHPMAFLYASKGRRLY